MHAAWLEFSWYFYPHYLHVATGALCLALLPLLFALPKGTSLHQRLGGAYAILSVGSCIAALIVAYGPMVFLSHFPRFPLQKTIEMQQSAIPAFAFLAKIGNAYAAIRYLRLGATRIGAWNIAFNLGAMVLSWLAAMLLAEHASYWYFTFLPVDHVVFYLATFALLRAARSTPLVAEAWRYFHSVNAMVGALILLRTFLNGGSSAYVRAVIGAPAQLVLATLLAVGMVAIQLGLLVKHGRRILSRSG